MSNTIPPGTYQLTSRNVRISDAGDGRITITADTQMANGSWTTSSLKYDIANCNGQLKFAPDGC